MEKRSSEKQKSGCGGRFWVAVSGGILGFFLLPSIIQFGKWNYIPDLPINENDDMTWIVSAVLGVIGFVIGAIKGPRKK
jgi:hypothetical protein